MARRRKRARGRSRGAGTSSPGGGAPGGGAAGEAAGRGADGTASEPPDPAAATGAAAAAALPWWKQPGTRFLAVFALLAVAFQVAHAALIVGSAPFRAYNVASSRFAWLMLRALGQDAHASGEAVTCNGHAILVKAGCDGLEAMGILVAATLAFPAAPLQKLKGLAVGLPLLFLLNAARIGSLAWVGGAFPKAFETMHVHVWPAALIVAAVAAWLLWAVRWARPSRPSPRPDAA